MPTLEDVRTVHANDATNDTATLTVLLDHLQQLEARVDVIEKRVKITPPADPHERADVE